MEGSGCGSVGRAVISGTWGQSYNDFAAYILCYAIFQAFTTAFGLSILKFKSFVF